MKRTRNKGGGETPAGAFIPVTALNYAVLGPRTCFTELRLLQQED
jgi:hypothetical protein